MPKDDIKYLIFSLVRARLLDRSDSLVRFHRHWKGSLSGIEGWFKLEFVAAIEPHVAVIHTGGAGGKGRGGRFYADLILEPSGGEKILIETKAGGKDWWYGGNDAAQRYSGQLLTFLSRTSSPICESHRQKVQALDPDVQLAHICDVETDNRRHSFYFGMADLRDKTKPVEHQVQLPS